MELKQEEDDDWDDDEAAPLPALPQAKEEEEEHRPPWQRTGQTPTLALAPNCLSLKLMKETGDISVRCFKMQCDQRWPGPLQHHFEFVERQTEERPTGMMKKIAGLLHVPATLDLAFMTGHFEGRYSRVTPGTDNIPEHFLCMSLFCDCEATHGTETASVVEQAALMWRWARRRAAQRAAPGTKASPRHPPTTRPGHLRCPQKEARPHRSMFLPPLQRRGSHRLLLLLGEQDPCLRATSSCL